MPLYGNGSVCAPNRAKDTDSSEIEETYEGINPFKSGPFVGFDLFHKWYDAELSSPPAQPSPGY